MLTWCIIIPLCFSGMYCASNGLALPTGLCDPGYYCPEGQNVSSPVPYVCTPGHHCPTGSPAEVPCSPGNYQDEFGQVNQGC